ncbi:MFS transporter [Cysteiniphilum sp. 19S12-1]|uniref:MFS transporter n=1 Tax=Cysteiniphilum sp. 19S12-1 TaxID=3453130 RepID=UPI003F85A2B5
MVSRIDYSQKKQILAISLGNGFEAYDFVLYGMLSQTFSVVFFPDNMDADIRVILSFILFLSAYIARPFGALLWGVIGDKFGRKVVLTYTISLMSVSAIGMILIPGYAVIGAAAPVIVIILRIIQGIAFSGEFPTVMVSLYESAPNNRRGFFCSFTEITGTFGHFIGIILCVFLIFYMDKNMFMTYGWKIPFGFSLIFIFVVYYIRTHFIETLNLSSENKVRIPIISNFRDNIWSSLKITLFVSTNSFLLFSFLFYTNRLISNYHAQPVDDYIFSWIVQLCCVGLLVTFLVIIGSIVDRIGIMKVSFIGHILILIFYYPIFYYLIGPVLR